MSQVGVIANCLLPPDPATLPEILQALLAQAGYQCSRFEIRDPEQHEAALAEIEGVYPGGWHRESDCIGPRFAVWSDHTPTEVRFLNGKLLTARDGDLILLDNELVEHRMPQTERGRWFARLWNVTTLTKER
jgi:hypothetical protein